MRQLFAAIVVVCALAACSPANTPPAEATTTSTATATTPATTSAPVPVAIDQNALGGQWSFDRDCGLSDLVFTNTSVTYYDYADHSNVVSYDGTWAVAPGNTVVLSLHRLDTHGAPSGPALTYNLNVTAPIAGDLTGTFGQPGALRDINAKRCDNSEDRE